MNDNTMEVENPLDVSSLPEDVRRLIYIKYRQQRSKEQRQNRRRRKELVDKRKMRMWSRWLFREGCIGDKDLFLSDVKVYRRWIYEAKKYDDGICYDPDSDTYPYPYQCELPISRYVYDRLKHDPNFPGNVWFNIGQEINRSLYGFGMFHYPHYSQW